MSSRSESSLRNIWYQLIWIQGQGKVFHSFFRHFNAEVLVLSWQFKLVELCIFVQNREKASLSPNTTMHVKIMSSWPRRWKSKRSETVYLCSVFQKYRKNWKQWRKALLNSTMNAGPSMKHVKDFPSSSTRRKENCWRLSKERKATFQRLKLMLSWWQLCERRKTDLFWKLRVSVTTSLMLTLTLII